MSDSIPPGWHFRQGPVARQFRTPATWFIVATIITSYFFQLYYAFVLNSPAYDFLFSFDSESFQHGDWWQIWTYAWLHAEGLPLHILLNVWMIVILGPVLERTIGTLRFVTLYLLAAPASVVAFELWHYPEPVGLIGASGCAFALLTAVAVQFPHRRVGVLLLFILPLRMKLLNFALAICAAEALMMAFGILPFIAHAAHLGGAAAGVALGLLFRPENHSEISSHATRDRLQAQAGGKPVDMAYLPPQRN